jgi:hypothetical protein
MNKWRRAEPPYEGMKPTPYTPEQYGKAIDHAINAMENFLLVREDVENAFSYIIDGKSIEDYFYY